MSIMPSGQGCPPTPSYPRHTKPARFDYAARLRELLRVRGLTLGALALALKSKSRIAGDLLAGDLSPTIAEARTIANWLGVSPGWLFFDEGSPETTHRAPGPGGLANSTPAHVPPAAEPKHEADQPQPARRGDDCTNYTNNGPRSEPGHRTLGERSQTNGRVGND